MEDYLSKLLGLEVKPNKENMNNKFYDYCGSFIDKENEIIIDVYTVPHNCKARNKTIIRFKMVNDDIPNESVYKVREVLYNYYKEHPCLMKKNKYNILYQVLSDEIIAQILNNDLSEIFSTIKSAILNRDCVIRKNKKFCRCEKCHYFNTLPSSYFIK